MSPAAARLPCPATVATFLSLGLLGTGCTTIVSGGKATPEAQGVRYSLPLPLIEVRPNPDGTIAIEPRYLADPNNEYVVSATSFLSSYTFDVQLQNNGLLKTVSMDAKNADLAKSAVGATGEIAKARFEAEGKAAEERAKAATEAGNKVAEAKLTLEKAKARLERPNELKEQPETKETITLAQIVQAELDVAEAQAAYNAALATASQAGGGNLDAGGNFDAAASPSFGEAWGPVYYRVVQSIDSASGEPTVRLIAARWLPDNSGQRLFRTASPAKPEQPTAPKNLTFKVKGSSVIRPDQQGNLQLTIEAESGTFAEVVRDSGKVFDFGTTKEVSIATLSDQTDKRTIIVDLPDNLASGKYNLQFRYRMEPGGALPFGEATFEVDR